MTRRPKGNATRRDDPDREESRASPTDEAGETVTPDVPMERMVVHRPFDWTEWMDRPDIYTIRDDETTVAKGRKQQQVTDDGEGATDDAA